MIQSKMLSSFAEAQEARANRELIGYLRTRFTEHLATQSDDDLLQIVQTARKKARTFGIEREDNVATFLDLTVMYPKFPDVAWATDILTTDKLHAPDKIALLRDRLRRHGVEL